MTSYSLEGSCANNTELQLAQSVKHSSAVRWGFGEIRPGLFALYNFKAEPVYIGDDWNELLAVYRARPKYEPKIVEPKSLRGIDLGKMEINL